MASEDGGRGPGGGSGTSPSMMTTLHQDPCLEEEGSPQTSRIRSSQLESKVAS